MKKKTVFRLCLMLVLACSFLTSACGQVVEQNQVALVLRTLGERKAEAINKQKAGGELGDNFEAELITAKRAPIDRPGIMILKFPLGLQVYEFSGRPSIESPNNEAFVVDAVGGQVTFDVVVHLYIDATQPDLKDRLIKLMKDYQLRQYSGSDDVLAKLVAGRFQQIIRQPFIEYCADKKVLDLMRNKEELNRYAKDQLNERFNPLGLQFTLVAVSSAMTVPKAQQDKLNQIMLQDMNIQVLEIKNAQIKPLDAKIEQLRQEGLTESAKLLNEATAKKIKTISEAEKQRRKMFINIIGKENYIRMETMLNMVRNLENSQTQITIVPENARVYLDQQPTSKIKKGE